MADIAEQMQWAEGAELWALLDDFMDLQKRIEEEEGERE